MLVLKTSQLAGFFIPINTQPSQLNHQHNDYKSQSILYSQR
ncbi:hypothetical protein PLIP_a0235 [Pseudoalteromonas lipolytica LMEB 39]|nr:hypothetical protein [Pseudoalteromonas lipolytica LMEB 39]